MHVFCGMIINSKESYLHGMAVPCMHKNAHQSICSLQNARKNVGKMQAKLQAKLQEIAIS